MAWYRDHKRPAGREDGFSIIEVAVALAMTGMGLLALAATLPMVKADLTRSDQKTRAVFLAQETAEWLHGLSYGDSLLETGTWVEGGFETNYDRSWTVEADIPMPGVKRVTVNVTRSDDYTESAQAVFLHAEVGR